jgi:MFS superfamily sulfate permease-like transporter
MRLLVQAMLLLAITFATTIALGIELGLLIGLGISVFLIIQHTAFPHIALLGRVPGTDKYRDIALFKEATTIPVRSTAHQISTDRARRVVAAGKVTHTRCCVVSPRSSRG